MLHINNAKFKEARSKVEPLSKEEEKEFVDMLSWFLPQSAYLIAQRFICRYENLCHLEAYTKLSEKAKKELAIFSEVVCTAKAIAGDYKEYDKLTVVIEPTNTGYSCYVIELNGLVSVGDTIDEIKENMKEVFELNNIKVNNIVYFKPG